MKLLGGWVMNKARTILLEALQRAGNIEVYLQGTLSYNFDFPNRFITFWTADSSGVAYYDNKTNATVWEYQIIVYSTNYSDLVVFVERVTYQLEMYGFIQRGKGRDIPSDLETYIGWAMDWYYIENEGVV